MLKKSLLLVITLLVVGLIVVPQVRAQDYGAEMEKLTADLMAGRITMQEFERRIAEIEREMTQQNPQAAQQYEQDSRANQQQRQQQQQQSQQRAGQIVGGTYAGATAGWPAASVFRRYGVTVNQPNIQSQSGMTYSHRIQGEKLIIYAFKNFIAGDAMSMANSGYIDEERRALRMHFESAFGGNLEIEDPTKTNVVPTATNRGPFPYYTIHASIDEIATDTYVGGDFGILAKYIVIEIEPGQSWRSYSMH